MAKKKQGGKLKQQTRPNPKYLGVKVSGGEKVTVGSVLVRQRGTKFAPGKNVKVGRDQTLFAVKTGAVKFGQRMGKKQVSVV
ncbi:50S ribosomal protein L27 [Candidatus Woesebacteria bacterium RIFCSPHIGHO2_01_FULL_38_10]|uniref:Large ribosomal subunit protein bL27 n=1 Tax=Candidatus Woesebacteria bacterium RIFCSPLOWO2_01_FULL_39_10b TaxID=1802517 RepID=A0A1F8B805_9BACT|nr:MAG: 50S ribosomal protein L27 [Candidatus Woesebacteria bacterium RIFCSPHIGHO2_01_FULL_38_10]OGM60141.1 MAG: 50S ribosomal protein L27 [Candidatus Woesebacteria bacterium RIFCSPLOWO2_01_FULL_39_10b]